MLPFLVRPLGVSIRSSLGLQAEIYDSGGGEARLTTVRAAEPREMSKLEREAAHQTRAAGEKGKDH